MNAIVTVVGSDKVGIIAKVSAYMADNGINIINITHTILSGNLVMMMMVNLDNAKVVVEDLRENMNKLAVDMGVEINVMNEKVFSAMHRV